MKHQSLLYRMIAAWLIVGGLILAAASQSAAQQNSNLVITQVDISRFPAVDVSIGTRDGNLAALDASKVTIT
jgi:hypothetical protein